MSFALGFFIASVIAGVLGFTGISGGESWGWKLLFFAFLVLSLVALVAHAYRPRSRS